MTKATSLSKRAIDLLLQAMEARSTSLQASTLHQVSRRATDLLLEAKLLVANGYVPVVAAMDDYEDEPIQATWSPEQKSFGYHDSTGRWIKVDNQESRRARSTRRGRGRGLRSGEITTVPANTQFLSTGHLMNNGLARFMHRGAPDGSV